MLAEHLVYSTAIAIIAGMLFFRYSGRDTSWIIILVSYSPDLDLVGNLLLRWFGRIFLYWGHAVQFLRGVGFAMLNWGATIVHGSFHNLLAMIIFSVMMSVLLHSFGIRYLDSFLFTLIGFGAHLFEDALVFTVGYRFLWPFSSAVYGLGWIATSGYEENYNANFFHIANVEVLTIGLLFLFAAILIRTRFEGFGWMRWYIPEKIYKRYFIKNKKTKATF